MTVAGWIEILLFLAVLTALTPVFGGYMARVFAGEHVALSRVMAPVERGLYRVLGVDPERGQDWKAYARSVLVLSAAFGVLLYVILRTQTLHPWNPRNLSSGTWDVSFNTTAAFLTNTNWQFYAGETTLSSFSQMAGLAVQNFVSAGVGIAVLIAFIRGLASRSGKELGVFYVDFTRCVLYVLLPISVLLGLFLVSQGALQTLGGPVHATGLTGLAQTFARGPVASQESIKMLGTNGGGFFNVNSAMPYENPTWLTNFVEMLSVLSIPAALTATYGRMVDNRRQGWMVFGAMMALFVVAVVIVYVNEVGLDAGDARGRPDGRQPRGQGAALRDRLHLAVRRRHHRRLVRRGERRDGVAERPRRCSPDGADDDRRGHLGRRRLGPVLDAPVRHPRRVHLRPDGRAHARSSWARRSRRGRSS